MKHLSILFLPLFIFSSEDNLSSSAIEFFLPLEYVKKRQLSKSLDLSELVEFEVRNYIEFCKEQQPNVEKIKRQARFIEQSYLDNLYIKEINMLKNVRVLYPFLDEECFISRELIEKRLSGISVHLNDSNGLDDFNILFEE